ncbi:MAG: HD domain-containing protein [Pseudomonadota bacterium]
MGTSQRIRDPLHDLIKFDEEPFESMLWEVIQTAPYQRLRRIKQLAFSEFVYPGATHTRFAHSIGVFHTARQLMQIVERDLEKVDRWKADRARVSIAAALLHDVGHGPFSHAFETVCEELQLSTTKHEERSASIIRNTEIGEILEKHQDRDFKIDVASLIAAGGPTDVYSSVVSSQFDADRLDYMRRDRLMTGTQHSEIDYTWLVENLKIARLRSGIDDEPTDDIETFVLDQKAYYAAETYVLGLFQLYPTVFYHKATRCMEAIFTQLLMRIGTLVKDDDYDNIGLPKGHPIISFFRNPESLENFLELDDTTFWGAMSQLCSAPDECVSQLAGRLASRNLWKTFDLRLTIEKRLQGCEPDAVERTIANAQDEILAWSTDNSANVPRAVLSSTKRDPYKVTPISASPLNKVFIESGDELVELREISPVVRAAKTYRLNRVYYADEDNEALRQIEKITESCIREQENGTV